ncbi:uncharacterized protein CIMG_00226 [Coccidioides immitis RS]|uniref:Uncharacterized protein n=4 Tax=Coccidioides immitis TaxID=5501 RepID=A0A0E1RY20_COCIM|nr:uncharacterized protein CIMG_00226 [Coccidioides immitis RS]EAS34872.1 hypothetical protein CIMG_00226 [Coccidioides immitis RS]KMP00061.1 hypothetical protein CIRG_00203 [Coccidioides immitis RMSCC 2394]KMU81845.1 hypothetical protein CISG_02861 [Coccidioides immitis RMSCC 3703]KMU87183.1 hypothetical protein CIHG_05124 [Coccidioides immitis H538.4]
MMGVDETTVGLLLAAKIETKKQSPRKAPEKAMFLSRSLGTDHPPPSLWRAEALTFAKRHQRHGLVCRPRKGLHVFRAMQGYSRKRAVIVMGSPNFCTVVESYAILRSDRFLATGIETLTGTIEGIFEKKMMYIKSCSPTSSTTDELQLQETNKDQRRSHMGTAPRMTASCELRRCLVDQPRLAGWI